jgi:glycosyltransferase involved in cell wall biosynthesis
MIHFFVNASAASAGGGLTYIRNLVPEIEKRRDIRATIWVQSALRAEFSPSSNVEYRECAPQPSLSRFWSEQRQLPELVRKSGANILLSAGNFALFRSPVPQILLSRNALYLSQDFYRDLLSRGDLRLWMDTRLKGGLARRSIRVADYTLAPTNAFAAELSSWVGKPVKSLHHGFDRENFFCRENPLPETVQALLDGASGCVNLLFVSHYNYYRNFELLLNALPLLQARLAPRQVRVILTCKLGNAANHGEYNADNAAVLAKRLGIEGSIVQLGPVPYLALHHVYRQCDLYVTPAYAESFAHPLVEAMASGLAVVASDIPVHREICGPAARYFERHSPQALTDAVCETLESPSALDQQRQYGKQRSLDFSWSHHLDALLEYAEDLLSSEARAS